MGNCAKIVSLNKNENDMLEQVRKVNKTTLMLSHWSSAFQSREPMPAGKCFRSLIVGEHVHVGNFCPTFSSTFCRRSLVLTFHLIWSNHQALCEQHTLMKPFTDQIWTRLPPVFYWNGSSNSDLLMSEADRCSDNDLSLTPPTQKKKNPHRLRLFDWLSLSLALSLSSIFWLLWLLCVSTPFSLREGLVGTCQATKVCNVDSSPFAHWLITDSMFFITCRSDPQNRHSLMCFHSWINSFLRANTSIIGCRLTWKGFVYQRAQWFFFFC